MRFWAGPQLLIIDELGYLPMPAEAASHLFQVVTRRYEHGSIILTTNRHIADWGQIFADTTPATAILDRLLHHATVLSDQRRQLPHARPPRRHPRAPTRAHRPPAGWGCPSFPGLRRPVCRPGAKCRSRPGRRNARRG